MVVGIAMFAGCARAPAALEAAQPARELPALPEVWVDASAPAGGDGSRERPKRTLPEALGASAARVHLKSGLYSGPVSLAPGTQLVGHGEVVVFADGAEPWAAQAVDARLENVHLQGGQVGLLALGRVSLFKVGFSGQRATAVRAAPESVVGLEQVRLEGTLSGTTGLEVAAGATARVSESRATGAFRKALSSEGTLVVDGFETEGPSTAVHVGGGDAVVGRVRAVGGSGPAVFCGAASLKVDGLVVDRHEYGVQSRGAQVVLRNLLVRRTQSAGLALVTSRSEVWEASLEQPGTYAGVQVMEGEALLSRVRVLDAIATGIVVKGSTATLEKVTVARVTPDGVGANQTNGDGLEIRGGTVTLKQVEVNDVHGVGVVAANHAVLGGRQLTVIRAGVAGLLVEQESRADLAEVVVVAPGQVGFVVPDKSSLTVGPAAVTPPSTPWVYAECAVGAAVTLTPSRGARPPERAAACVRLLPAASPER